MNVLDEETGVAVVDGEFEELDDATAMAVLGDNGDGQTTIGAEGEVIEGGAETLMETAVLMARTLELPPYDLGEEVELKVTAYVQSTGIEVKPNGKKQYVQRLKIRDVTE